ncbi:odorant receptor 85c-like isoform X3 [Chelonus insularis]|uniref:odorant receptor 85c-like isoform X3 n=1 Tax=Chelonus insularis TaxID=460826 RepID=UPI00158A7751|nr:odorant receptor 85c-like isoform X3 [Chelonus insularis]
MFHEKILVTEILGFAMIYLETFLNIILWKVKMTAFYKFLQEFEDFIKTSKRNERKVIDKYFNRYRYFYIFIAIFATISFLLRVIIAPIQGRQKLPFAIYYPFTIKPYSSLHYLIYLSQSIASFQCSAQIIFPITISMIMLHVSMKLELLADEIEHAEHYNQLIICIQHHQECIKLVERINRVFGAHIMKSYIIPGLSIIFGSMKFIYKPDFFTIGRSFLTITSCLIGTYIYNGPADDIYEMSQTIGNSLYGMKWSNDLIKMQKSVMIVIQRVQRPLAISPLKGLMPSLNRKIYTSEIYSKILLAVGKSINYR